MLARSATRGSSAFATNNVLVASDTSFYVDLLFGTNFGSARSTNVTPRVIWSAFKDGNIELVRAKDANVADS